MHSPDTNFAIGYIVSTWPRLSQTFVLNEILALERQGVRLRIFSAKDPTDEPVHASVAYVRAPVTYLSLGRHWKPALRATLRLARDLPGCFGRALLQAIRYRSWGVIRRFFQAVYLAHLLRREPVARLHAHFATAPTLVAMFTHQLIDVPYTFTAHARDIYVDTQPRLLQAEMSHADAVVTVSEYNRRYLSTRFDLSSKVRCVYNGLDLRQFCFELPRAAYLDPPIILAVGRLIEKKGLGDLIAAADILRRHGYWFHVEIVGAGPLRAALEAKIKQLRLETRVKLFDAQPQEIIRLAYRRATVFALPCVVGVDGDRDGIPTVLLEAMASGVPVVSTPVSGIPELIEAGHNGLLVTPGNPTSLADGLAQLIADPMLRVRLACAARDTIEARFDIDRNASQLLALFQNGAAARSDRACENTALALEIVTSSQPGLEACKVEARHEDSLPVR